ncbi:MAG: hypothetical protein IK095_07395 [Oscillospiraceae bacterium]|nr:hypothetical protein [Oscillospiraceae bacterium]
MDYTGKTRLSEILADHPWLAEELPKLDPIFEKLRSPAAWMVAKRMTVQDAGRFGGRSVEFLLSELDKVIREHEGTAP